MKKLKITLFFILTVLFAFSQQIGKVSKVNVDKFPKVEFTLNLYKPDAKENKDFEIFENQQKIQFTFSRTNAPIADTQKHILILFEDMTHTSHALQREYFQYVLENSLPKFVNKGDKVNIAVFDRNRGSETSLRFLLENYTDDVELLKNAANTFRSIYDEHSNQKSSELYDALDDGMADLHEKFPNKNTFILELSAGFNLSANNAITQEGLIATSREYRIPIYSVYYNIYDNRTDNDYAEKSFGLFFLSDKSRNDKDAAKEKVIEFMTNALKRHYGFNYTFSYDTKVEQDGKLHTVSIKVDGQAIEEKFQAPACDIACFIKKNTILVALILIIIIGFIIGLVLFLKKKKEKELALQAEKEAQQTEKLRQIEIQRQKDKEEQVKKQELQQLENERLEQKMREEREEQLRFQQRLEAEKLAEQRQHEQQLLEKQQEEQNKRLTEEMRNNRGGFPSLKIVSHGLNKDFVINKPIISFGREKHLNDFFLQEPTVSGKHFEIQYFGGDYFIQDVGSTNGTKINGMAVRRHKLKHNDIIQAGKAQMMFVW